MIWEDTHLLHLREDLNEKFEWNSIEFMYLKYRNIDESQTCFVSERNDLPNQSKKRTSFASTY